jgi:hypothetical protein
MQQMSDDSGNDLKQVTADTSSSKTASKCAPLNKAMCDGVFVNLTSSWLTAQRRAASEGGADGIQSGNISALEATDATLLAENDDPSALNFMSHIEIDPCCCFSDKGTKLFLSLLDSMKDK